jgi:hypothetical protein
VGPDPSTFVTKSVRPQTNQSCTEQIIRGTQQLYSTLRTTRPLRPMLGGHPHLRLGTVPTPSPLRHMPPRRSNRGSGVCYRRARQTLSMTTTSTIAATRVPCPTQSQRSWATRRPEVCPEGDAGTPGARPLHDSVRGHRGRDTARVHGEHICHADNKMVRHQRVTRAQNKQSRFTAQGNGGDGKGEEKKLGR